ncbi:Hypothetical predicted protein [Podarcis lilfordi]|uniref:Uncharacterized protein n=1 Tax=Podarcis lilfordi TaxID=74358 RepID=A0AA35JWZ0_9SAUR|nr:Hypothetical predicted protein [Podarcis lilfordi]
MPPPFPAGHFPAHPLYSSPPRTFAASTSTTFHGCRHSFPKVLWLGPFIITRKVPDDHKKVAPKRHWEAMPATRESVGNQQRKRQRCCEWAGEWRKEVAVQDTGVYHFKKSTGYL